MVKPLPHRPADAPLFEPTGIEAHRREGLGPQARPALNPLLKLALEMGPLGLFFLANARPALFLRVLPGLDPADPSVGAFTATAVFMAATVLALGLSYALVRRLPVMPMVSGVVVVVFGAMALWLHDTTFVQVKPTIINALFGLILLGGLAFGRSFISIVLDTVFDLTPEGWRTLTWRWGLFFLFLAALNEVVRHVASWDAWVTFKVFGTMPITVLFALTQVPLLLRHEVKREAAGQGPGEAG